MRPLDRTVNILGTTYVITFRKEEHEPRFKECDGFVDTTIKEICICVIEPNEKTVQDLNLYTNKVIRHEIIHAFLYESGLWSNSTSGISWAMNEEMIDWLAIQFYKIEAAFIEAECK